MSRSHLVALRSGTTDRMQILTMGILSPWSYALDFDEAEL